MVKKREYYHGIGAIAEELGKSRTHVSLVVHGKRKSKPLALLLWNEYGIKSKGQGLKYE